MRSSSAIKERRKVEVIAYKYKREQNTGVVFCQNLILYQGEKILESSIFKFHMVCLWRDIGTDNVFGKLIKKSVRKAWKDAISTNSISIFKSK